MAKNSIATAYVQIIPTTDGIQNELDKDLGGAGDSAGGKAGKRAGKSFGATFKKIIVTLGLGEALKKTLDFGAELQQNLGGTEAVFGKFADTIQKSAEEAYKNMGLSASDYMATANKMGSLFQGSGLTQQKSLELTSAAMQRAADVASVMGIDTTAAMESIAGAAKGNFTMMDNLGVAMNATTLSAYALEEGVNFDWNTASNAEKAELAMKMFMDRTSQYEGNFARESEETFSGSLGAMKAIGENVLANLALGEDVTPSLEELLETTKIFFEQNFIPAIENVLSGLTKALAEVFVGADTLKDINDWMEEHEDLVTVLTVALGTLTTAVIAYTVAQNALAIAVGLYTAATTVATAVSTAFGVVMAFLTSPITLIIAAIGALVAIVVICIKHWKEIKQTVQDAVERMREKVGQLKKDVVEKFEEIKRKITEPIETAKEKVGQAIDSIQGFFDGLKFELPHINLPHFTLSGEFSLKKMTVPKLSVEWYSKAMDNAMLLNSPTIFGASGNTLLGAGEAGAEVVAGANTLMGMINSTVRDAMVPAPEEATEADIVRMLRTYLPKLVEVCEQDTTLNINNREFARAVKAVG